GRARRSRSACRPIGSGSRPSSSAARRDRSRGGAATACWNSIVSFLHILPAMNPLSPKRRSELRAEAHKLSPVVIIGDKGLTDEVLAEVDRSLTAHELIKVRAATDEREARDAWLEAICEKLAAHPVQ